MKSPYTLFLFLLLVAVFLLLSRKPVAPAPPATFTPTLTLTLVPTVEPSPTPLPTVTPVPPVVVVVEEAPILLPGDGGTFDEKMYTATVCANVPVFSQPASNYNLIIYNLYKGNLVEVTGQSQFWARLALTSTGQVGYVPIQYVTTC